MSVALQQEEKDMMGNVQYVVKSREGIATLSTETAIQIAKDVICVELGIKKEVLEKLLAIFLAKQQEQEGEDD